jgi:hypothetical protein
LAALDLLKWDQALYGDTLLAEASKAAVTAAVLNINGRDRDARAVEKAYALATTPLAECLQGGHVAVEECLLLLATPSLDLRLTNHRASARGKLL